MFRLPRIFYDAMLAVFSLFSFAVRFRCFPLPLNLNRWRCSLKPCNGKFFNVLQWIFRVLLRFRCLCCFVARLVDTLPETPSGRICVLRCSKPVWDLNHRCSFRKSCNAFVVSELAAGFCLAAGFRYSPFPLHLNQGNVLSETV